jgi:hypothetical protein
VKFCEVLPKISLGGQSSHKAMPFELGDLAWRNEQNLLPHGFDKDNALRKLQNWIDGDDKRLGKRQEEKKLNTKEKEHPDHYYVRTVPKKKGQRSGVEPRLINDKINYPWISDDVNKVSSEEHQLIFDEGYVLEAVVKAEGRCFWYSLSVGISIITGTTVQPGDVKRKIMAKLNERLNNPNEEFKVTALTFMRDEDRHDNNNKFAKWFCAEIYNVPYLNNETNELYYKRVMKCILQLESLLSLKRFYFLVQYLSFDVYQWASCGLLLFPFLDAYPTLGLSVFTMKAVTDMTKKEVVTVMERGTTMPILGTPGITHVTLMLRQNHYFLLRPVTESDRRQKTKGHPKVLPLLGDSDGSIVEDSPAPSGNIAEEQLTEAQLSNKIVMSSTAQRPISEAPRQAKVRASLPMDLLVKLSSEFRQYLLSGKAELLRGKRTIPRLDDFFGEELDVKVNSECVKKISTLKAICELDDAVAKRRNVKPAIDKDSTEFIQLLFQGLFICEHCRSNSAQSGSRMVLSKASLQSHLDSQEHQSNAKKTLKSQTIVPALKQSSPTAGSLTEDDLFEAALVARLVGHGIPLHAIKEIFDQDAMLILKSMTSGFHSRRSQKRTVLHNADYVIRDLIRSDLKNKVISIIADSVSTNIDGGNNVLFIYASSPQLNDTGEILLAAREFVTHSARNQAKIVIEVLNEFDIPLTKIMWFCGDNVATNWKTARLLQVPFANCLPHSLNLVVKRFMNAFQVTSKIHLLSTFVNLGVSMDRRQLLSAFGLQLTRIDYSITRWQGLLESMMYLVGNIDRKHEDIRRLSVEKNPAAFERLKEHVRRAAKEYAKKEQQAIEEAQRAQGFLALNTQSSQSSILPVKSNVRIAYDDNDVLDIDGIESTIKHTQKDAGNSSMTADKIDQEYVDVETDNNLPAVWRQFYQFLLAADRDTITARKTMEFLVDWNLYTEALLVTQCLRKMPSIISMSEGGHSYTGSKKEQILPDGKKASHDELLTSVETNVNDFMKNLRTMTTDTGERDRCVSSAIIAAKKGARRYFHTELSSDVSAPLSDQQRDVNLTSVEAKIESYRNMLQSTLQQACDDVFSKSSDGFVNLLVHSALQRLKLRRLFLLLAPLPTLVYENLSSTNEDAIWDFLKPLLPMVKVDVKTPASYATTYLKCSQKDLYDAYKDLCLLVNGNEVQQPLVGTVKDPLDFFLQRSRNTILSRADRVLAHLAVRALVTPLSSVAAERGGSYLRKLGAGKDRNRMGMSSISENIFMWANKDYGDKLMKLARARADSLKAPTVNENVKSDHEKGAAAADDDDDENEEKEEREDHEKSKKKNEDDEEQSGEDSSAQHIIEPLKRKAEREKRHDLQEEFRIHGKKMQPIPQIKGQGSIHQFFTPKEKVVASSATSASKTQQQAIALDYNEDDDDDDDNMGSAGMATSAVIRKDVHDKGTSSKVTGKRHASSHGIEEHDLDDLDDNTGFLKRRKTRKR